MLTSEMLMSERSVAGEAGRRLPAKILKRVGQLGRLGPRGIARTAYVASLGTTVYAITDPARQVAYRIHRQKCWSQGLDEREERLKARLSAAAASNDAVPPRGSVAPETRFGADRGRFVQSLEAMLDLADKGCAVPPVLAVDRKENAFTTARVAGKRFGELDKPARESAELKTAIEQALVAVHQAGYILDHVDEDILVFKDGEPVIVDLSHAVPLAGLSRDMSVYLRDLDRAKVNHCFGTRLLTAASLRRSRSRSGAEAATPTAKFYAPIVVRDDIHWGKIWNTDVGTGRWNFIMKGHLPIPQGGTVLDLGSNNGFNPLQMLRSGVASAVGIELEEKAIQQGEFVKSVYEWLDNRSYDFRYIQGSFGDIASFSLPRFDVVTALCSLYYLDEAQMHEVIGTIRRLTDVLVIQCNTDRLIDRSSDDTFRKASVEFAIDALDRAGFANRELIAPPGYSRPLIIARAG
jgi:hypothetical protein